MLRKHPTRTDTSDSATRPWWCAAVLTLLTFTGSPSTAQANDASFGGAGGDLVALQQTQVQMRSEDIVMTFDDYRWHVTAS